MEKPIRTCSIVGTYIMHKYYVRAREGGHAVTARALRKQGFPLWVTLLILFGKEERL